MKLFKRIAATVLTCCMVVSSFQLTGVSAKAASNNWNFEIYMCGSDLESDSAAGTYDILEIMRAKEMPENVNIIIQTGGSTQWYYDEEIKTYYKDELHMTDDTIAKLNIKNISADFIQRYRVKFDNRIEQNGKIITYPSLELLSENEGVNNPEKTDKPVYMGDEEVLSDFMRDTFAKDDHNVLVLWNHGGGTVDGVCIDGYNGDSLSLKEIDNALEENKGQLADGKLDMIGFDACLMSTFETLAVASKHANFAAASMTLEATDGWYYTPIMKALAQGVRTGTEYTGKELAVSVVDAYNEYYLKDKESENYDYDANMAAFDLSHMDKLISEFDDMAITMVHLTSNGEIKEDFNKAAYKAIQLDRDTELIGFTSFLKKTISFAKKYINKYKSSKEQLIMVNVKNCENYITKAEKLQTSLCKEGFCLKVITGGEESYYYKEKGISFYYPRLDGMDRLEFAQWCYKELGISEYYAAFAYGVAYDTAELQSIVPKTNIYWNKRNQEYDVEFLSKDAKIIKRIGDFEYLRDGKREILIGAQKSMVDKGKGHLKVSKTYYEFNGMPICLNKQDDDNIVFGLVVSVNGGKEDYLTIINGDDKFAATPGLKEGDVVTPIIELKNGKEIKDVSYKIRKSDISEDGCARLPIKEKKLDPKKLRLEVLLKSVNGSWIFKKINHYASLEFSKATIHLDRTVFVATGKRICPKVTVKIGNKKLKQGKDYRVTYKNNLGAGSATVQVEGLGKYKYGKFKQVNFTIKVNHK